MNYTSELIDFIKKSPTAYHTVETVKEMLLSAGYTECSEKELGSYSDGGRHFVIRNGTSIIAFRGKCEGGFMICASHSDTPCFKVKSELSGNYLRASVEKYGGSIFYSWLDRPLSVAGRITVRTEDGIETKLVNIDRDLRENSLPTPDVIYSWDLPEEQRKPSPYTLFDLMVSFGLS